MSRTVTASTAQRFSNFNVQQSHLGAAQFMLPVKNPPANAGDIRDAGSVPGLGRSPGGGHGNPLQYSCLENPMDRGGWWAAVHRVTMSCTQLKRIKQASKNHLEILELPYNPAIPLLGIHTEETGSERDTCTPMDIAALFIIARTWKQPRCPSADKWIRKQWYIYTMEYYSTIKNNTFESVLMRWMKLEPIIQSEVSQKEKQYSVLTHIYGI